MWLLPSAVFYGLIPYLVFRGLMSLTGSMVISILGAILSALASGVLGEIAFKKMFGKAAPRRDKRND